MAAGQNENPPGVANEEQAIEAIERIGTLDRHHIRTEFERRFSVQQMAQKEPSKSIPGTTLSFLPTASGKTLDACCARPLELFSLLIPSREVP